MSTHRLRVRSREREELVEFTDEVRRCLRESGAREGVCALYVRHTTAGLTVNENADPDVPRDMLHALRTLLPFAAEKSNCSRAKLLRPLRTSSRSRPWFCAAGERAALPPHGGASIQVSAIQGSRVVSPAGVPATSRARRHQSM